MVTVRGRKQSEINPALCKGCGLCVAACRGRAITLHGFTDQQLLGQLQALLWTAEPEGLFEHEAVTVSAGGSIP